MEKAYNDMSCSDAARMLSIQQGKNEKNENKVRSLYFSEEARGTIKWWGGDSAAPPMKMIDGSNEYVAW